MESHKESFVDPCTLKRLVLSVSLCYTTKTSSRALPSLRMTSLGGDCGGCIGLKQKQALEECGINNPIYCERDDKKSLQPLAEGILSYLHIGVICKGNNYYIAIDGDGDFIFTRADCIL